MPGTLYVVATPIGNLEDVTLRALRILREVSLIAAEDTRRTARLLQHYSISTRTTSLHDHNERVKTPELIARLQAGESIALVSDAGTPLVSDPGTHLVAAAHTAGMRVEPIPGPSAVMAALSGSGLSAREFLFVGFPPSRANARTAWVHRLTQEQRAIVLYEAPHRIQATLGVLLEVMGDRRVGLCRELTKIHENLVVRPISAHLREGLESRGEFTVVIEGTGSRTPIGQTLPEPHVLALEFGEMTNFGGLNRREGIKILSKKYGVSTRTVFATIEKTRSSVE